MSKVNENETPVMKEATKEIPGLEGVEIVRFGVPSHGEFILIEGRIYSFSVHYHLTCSRLIVISLPGWAFTRKDSTSDLYVAIKSGVKEPFTPRIVRAMFEPTNASEQAQLMEQLSKLPGWYYTEEQRNNDHTRVVAYKLAKGNVIRPIS